MKETRFDDDDCKKLLEKRQLASERYCQNASADNWSAFCRSRVKLVNVIKDKQDSFVRNCFPSRSSAKHRWNFIKRGRGSNYLSGNLTALRNSFGPLIVDVKNIATHFNYVFFSNLGYNLKQLIAEASNFTAGNLYFCFRTTLEKNSFDIIRDLSPIKPASPCRVPAGAIFDGTLLLVPYHTFI